MGRRRRHDRDRLVPAGEDILDKVPGPGRAPPDPHLPGPRALLPAHQACPCDPAEGGSGRRGDLRALSPGAGLSIRHRPGLHGLRPLGKPARHGGGAHPVLLVPDRPGLRLYRPLVLPLRPGRHARRFHSRATRPPLPRPLAASHARGQPGAEPALERQRDHSPGEHPHRRPSRLRHHAPRAFPRFSAGGQGGHGPRRGPGLQPGGVLPALRVFRLRAAAAARLDHLFPLPRLCGAAGRGLPGGGGVAARPRLALRVRERGQGGKMPAGPGPLHTHGRRPGITFQGSRARGEGVHRAHRLRPHGRRRARVLPRAGALLAPRSRFHALS